MYIWQNILCRVVVTIAVLIWGTVARGQFYTFPATARTDTLLDTNWQFIRANVAGAQSVGFDDSSWTNVTLPHTWNNIDGQQGGNSYYRGIAWYRLHYTVPTNDAGLRLFLKFEGAFSDANVYVNGSFVGEHQGGYAAFAYDVTPQLNVGADNVIAVEVNNAFNADIPPLNADFTFFGGLYRDVHLLAMAPVQVSPLDYGSPGVYITPYNVTSNSANLRVVAVVSNATASAQNITVRAVVTDAATNLVATFSNTVTLPASSWANVTNATVVANPHLWNGLADPYLYKAFVEVWSGTNILDATGQDFGFRYFNVDPANGFFLNGQHYDLHGVNMHQDWLNCGWALTNAQRQSNFVFLKQIGATAIRLSHYQHHDQTYQLADQNGIVVWSEVPIIDYSTADNGFASNTLAQLREMIRQRYNHPSVVCWSVYNEITLNSGPPSTNLINQEVQLVATEDTNRYSTAASAAGDSDPTTLYTQLIAFNKYYGWYSSPLNGIGSWADGIHATYPSRCIGVSEYGAGASVFQHSENPAIPANTASAFHPEEWQNIVHETNWILMKSRPFLWCKFIWNEFDFASASRNEGDTPGRNDKGLVTFDRQYHKDAFYFYQANWTATPMVYITGHTFTNRLSNSIIAKVYANCDSVQLFVNGVSQGVSAGRNAIFTWPVTLAPGSNFVQAIGTKGASNVVDSLFWIGPTTPPVAALTNPVGPMAWLGSTNDILQLTATASNPVPGVAFSTTWAQTSGPGTITFSATNALTTTASFSANGIYGISFTANNGVATTASLTVSVNATQITNGLLAWWKMDETAGTTAFDSSGNNCNATITGAVFTNGVLSNALYLNGTTSRATFPSPDTGQITLAGWVRAVGQGNSVYPRIFDTPGYRLFFRFDGSGTNGLDFATYSTANGDWFSGTGTISLGQWYHVAASYDRSSIANIPTEYVNGGRIPSPTVITSPSGAQPSYAGTGYIGNQAALNRGWSGYIDDLRIYNRLLSDAEVQALASATNVNLAPVVNAGTNQTVILPEAANLKGAVTDDGLPKSPGITTVSWSQVSGPAVVKFANSNSAATTANFPTVGTYVLGLEANDGQATTVSSVTITVVAPPMLVLQSTSPGLELSWPSNVGEWGLQVQSNPASGGIGTNWTTLPGPLSNPLFFPVGVSPGSVFYRLALTNPLNPLH